MLREQHIFLVHGQGLMHINLYDHSNLALSEMDEFIFYLELRMIKVPNLEILY